MLFAAMALAACAGHPRPPMASNVALPAFQMRATGHPGVAPLLLESQRSLLAAPSRRLADAVCTRPDFADTGPGLGPVRYLLLSGGSLNGAFGAGFFLGLAEGQGGTGSRLPPEPTVVTGISTGALQSTFLFLQAGHRPPADRNYRWVGGAAATPSAQDDAQRPALRAGRSNVEDLALAYTIRRERDILDVAPLGGVGMLLSGSKGRLDPLGRRLLDLISPGTIHDVAFEACRGRKLFVGVADVDDGQAYAIDLTRMALLAYDRSAFPRLADPGWSRRHMTQVRRAYVAALIASSSVPVGARPVTLLLKADNLEPARQRFRHLFVDGGARFGVFFDEIDREQKAGAVAADDYGVTLLVNTRLTIPQWRTDDDPLKPNRRWGLATLGLRTVDILENQVYRLSVAAVEQLAAQYGGMHMAYLHNENLGPTGADDGREWPDDHRYRGQACTAWHDQDQREGRPAQFYANYMACLIDYGRQRGQAGLWNVPARP